jgi:hypothetical protein
VFLASAVIVGPLHLNYVWFDCDLEFIDCDFADAVDFSFSAFRRSVKFDGSIFRGPTTFGGASAAHDFSISGCTFHASSRFTDIHIANVFAATGVSFRSADFQRISVGKLADFRPLHRKDELLPTRFIASTSFLEAVIHGSIIFNGATFTNDVTFGLLQVDGAAFFSVAHSHRQDLPNATPHLRTMFEGSVSFRGARVRGLVDFCGAIFKKRLTLEAAHFGEKARFGVSSSAGAALPTEFHGDLMFEGVHIGGDLDLDGAQFATGTGLGLLRVQIGGSAYFRAARDRHGPIPVRLGALNLFTTHINESALFQGCSFAAQVRIIRSQIDGDLRMESTIDTPTRFSGEVKVQATQVNGAMILHGVSFKAQTDFSHTEVARGFEMTVARAEGGNTATTFEDDVSFRSMRCAGDWKAFAARLAKRANFESLKVGGDLIIRQSNQGRGTPVRGAEPSCSPSDQGVCFGGEARFFAVRVEGAFQISDAQFGGTADFSFLTVRGGDALIRDCIFEGDAVFIGVEFKAGANFSGTHFKRETLIARTTIGGALLLAGTRCDGPLNLGDASCDIVRFGVDPASDLKLRHAQLGESIDLRGFTYRRLVGDWRGLLGKLYPYDRQVYLTLERFFRSIGDDSEADEVYLAQRRRESRLLVAKMATRGPADQAPAGSARPSKSSVRSRVIADRFQRWFFGYGVRPVRLLWISIAIILLGGVLFTRPGAVELKDPRPITAREPRDVYRHPLDFLEALMFSLRLFIPVVELPAGEQWTASHTTRLPWISFPYDGYASAQRLAGAILVPLGVAGLSGFLVRRERPK